MTVNIGWIGCGNRATEMLPPQLVRQDVRLMGKAVVSVHARQHSLAARQAAT